MAISIPVHIVSSKEKFTQNCIIPVKLFEASNFILEDFVLLQTNEKKYLCRVYTTLLPLTYISVSDMVTSKSFNFLQPKESVESIEYPGKVTPVAVSSFNTVAVKVIFNNNGKLISEKTAYEVVIYKILSSCVFGENCVVNCSGLTIADLFNIHCIIISKTVPGGDVYGKLLKDSKIEIIDLITEEQLCQCERFRCLQLGGMNDYINILKLNFMACRSCRILVTGPAGCGKSSLVKKFCSSFKCFFVFIDGLSIPKISNDSCHAIHKQFSVYLELFPNRTCILLIDHLDVIALDNLKQKSNAFMLVNLIHSLSNLNVYVIATAIKVKNLHAGFWPLFNREVNLGIPSFEQRRDIIKVLMKSLNCHGDYDRIAKMTPGFVGHDISSLLKAALTISKEKTIETQGDDLLHLTDEEFERALTNISPSVLKTSVWNMKVKPVYWKNIGGMFSIKQKLQMCVEWPLRNPELFKKVDLPCPHGVLLFGPPGCCKTTLARGLATECNANFFAANPAQIYSSYVGESEKNITELFYQARLCAPSIIFLDELDSLVSQRKLDSKAQGIGEKVLSTLLNEMDGFGTKIQFQNSFNMQKLLNDDADESTKEKKMTEKYSNDVIVVAATNRPDLIDDALLRPGRFDVILYVSPPNEEERESILLTLTEKMPVKDVDMKKIAAKTDLFSGADLKSLCNEAAMNALRENINASHMTEENFNEALRKIHPSITRQQTEMYEKLSSKYGTIVK